MSFLAEVLGEILGYILITLIWGFLKMTGTGLFWILNWGKKDFSAILESSRWTGFWGFMIWAGFIACLTYLGTPSV